MSIRIITKAIQRLSTVQTGKKSFFLLTKIYYLLGMSDLQNIDDVNFFFFRLKNAQVFQTDDPS